MLLKHSFSYLFARGLPGVINLLAMALYTRLLSPDDYGNYALIIAGVSLANVTLFQWLRLGLLRFLPSYQNNQKAFLSTILFGYITLVVLTGSCGAIASICISDPALRGFILLGVMLLWVQAFFELTLDLARIQLAPKRYGLLSIVKATIALAIGGSLAYLGFGVFGLIVGLMTGMLLSLSMQIGNWKYVRFRFIEAKVFHELLIYGLPLSATFILGFVIDSSDRFLLGWLLGTGATGMYAAGYDITKQTLGVLMMIMNLAAYPLAVRALEQGGGEVARQQLTHNIILLLTIALPCTAGFALLSSNIAFVFLGQAYRNTAISLIPWIALGSLFAGIKAFYFDLSFQLGQHTIGQVWVAIIAAITNVILNLVWIPHFGLVGAAYATVIAYGLGLFLSYAFGRSIFKLPLPLWDAAKIALATLGMTLALVPIVSLRGAWILAGQVAWGSVVFGFLLWFFDVDGIRLTISKLLRSKSAF